MKYDVYIEKIDDVNIRIHANLGIREQLEQVFRFRPENYQFTPKYKAGLWDGYIRMFNAYTCLMYTGLMKEVIDHCKRYSYSCYVDPKLLNYEKLTYDNIEDWFKNDLKPTTDDGKPLDIRDYQLDAIFKSIKFRRILLESATNSGKSAVIYAIMKWLFENDKIESALVVVPTIDLVNQMYSDFDEYSQHPDNDFVSADWVHKIFGGEDKWTDKPIVVSTWQSIKDMPPEWFEQFGCMIGDEAHGCEAKSLVKIIQNMPNCLYKIGMTGSLKDFEGSRFNLMGLFGPIVKIITAKEMIKRGDSTPLKIEGIMLEYSQRERKVLAAEKRKLAKENKELQESGKPKNNGAEYNFEKDFIIDHIERRKFVRNLAVTREGNTLVLFRFERHGRQLYEDIKAVTPDDRPVFYVDGKIKTKIRTQIRKITDKYTNAIIVASYGTFSTGINIKSLKHLILAFPYKSKIKIVQSIGRMLRKFKGKDVAMMWDICDDLQWKTKSNYAKDQFIERLKIYRNEQHAYKITKVELKDDQPDNQLQC